MTREELLKTREYWISKIQIDVFNLIENYRLNKGYNKTELANEMGFTKGYITQILSGDFDHKVSKLVDLALSFGKVPNMDFISVEDYISISENDNTLKIESASFKADYANSPIDKIKQDALIIAFEPDNQAA